MRKFSPFIHLSLTGCVHNRQGEGRPFRALSVLHSYSQSRDMDFSFVEWACHSLINIIK